MSMRRAVLALAVLSLAGPALAAPRAGTAGKRKPRPARVVKAPIDVAAAVASGDPDRRCGAALELTAAKELVRAALLIDACADLPARADAARAARLAIAKVAARDEWSPVEIVLTGKGAADAVVTVDGLADVPVTGGSLRLPAGSYHFTARTAGGEAGYDLVLSANSRALVMIAPPLPPQPPRDGVLDFTQDDGGAPMDAPIAGPPKVEHGSLLPERYLKGLKNCGAMACRKY